LGIPDIGSLNLAWGRTQYGFHNVKLTESEHERILDFGGLG
jgi:hypothetical protein